MEAAPCAVGGWIGTTPSTFLPPSALPDTSWLLMAELADIQQFVADLPDRGTLSAEAIMAYDQSGLPC